MNFRHIEEIQSKSTWMLRHYWYISENFRYRFQCSTIRQLGNHFLRHFFFIPGAKSDELPFQAQSLVSALNAHPEINVAEDWKFLGIFIGTNDACQFCLNQVKITIWKPQAFKPCEIGWGMVGKTILFSYTISHGLRFPSCRKDIQ